MKGISKEWTGAAAMPIVLLTLSSSDSYGYEIVQNVKRISDGSIKWKEASIYPVLKKLEKEGLIRSYWKVEDKERPRKYYTILDEGKKQLVIQLAELKLINKIFDQLLDGQKVD
ncbi:PadR family transcriptional regulator [uncultured Sunxiuqinia sp.]|uniref:PadR family transcriptional regulator n=1 Tax=uncultured Sunxiuqinia sp. TaxID=1573825 RepID=UPI0030DAD0D9|tara:strand:+ start:14350 stop:14691 length:342 start_codon:yes stop_codon:yes gene_type:complete